MYVKRTLLACALAASTALAQAPVEVESNPIDAGKVLAGSTAAATFVLHNRTDQPVRILRAAPS